MSRDEEEKETIFVVFYQASYVPDTFCAAFYDRNKAQIYANERNNGCSYGCYVVKICEIES